LRELVLSSPGGPVRTTRCSHGAPRYVFQHKPTFADDLADTVADDLHGDVAALRPPEVELAVDVVPEDGCYGSLRRIPITRAEGVEKERGVVQHLVLF